MTTTTTTTTTTTDAQSLKPSGDAATHVFIEYHRPTAFTGQYDVEPAIFTKKPVYHGQVLDEYRYSSF